MLLPLSLPNKRNLRSVFLNDHDFNRLNSFSMFLDRDGCFISLLYFFSLNIFDSKIKGWIGGQPLLEKPIEFFTGDLIENFPERNLLSCLNLFLVVFDRPLDRLVAEEIFQFREDGRPFRPGVIKEVDVFVDQRGDSLSKIDLSKRKVFGVEDLIDDWKERKWTEPPFQVRLTAIFSADKLVCFKIGQSLDQPALLPGEPLLPKQ